MLQIQNTAQLSEALVKESYGTMNKEPLEKWEIAQQPLFSSDCSN